jgi:hypothetical protein
MTAYLLDAILLYYKVQSIIQESTENAKRNKQEWHTPDELIVKLDHVSANNANKKPMAS